MQIIRVHADAPLKPRLGEPCNGCGVCCLAEPCPAGMLVSLRRRGACRALHWDAGASLYRCGLLAATAGSPRWLAGLLQRLIAAGAGCDSDAEVA